MSQGRGYQCLKFSQCLKLNKQIENCLLALLSKKRCIVWENVLCSCMLSKLPLHSGFFAWAFLGGKSSIDKVHLEPTPNHLKKVGLSKNELEDIYSFMFFKQQGRFINERKLQKHFLWFLFLPKEQLKSSISKKFLSLASKVANPWRKEVYFVTNGSKSNLSVLMRARFLFVQLFKSHLFT